MKNIRKITAFMLAFAAIALSACGNDGKEAVTETSPETVTASEETTVTEPEETTAESTETTVNESPESETEETTIDVAYEFFHQITPNNVTSPEVIKGALTNAMRRHLAITDDCSAVELLRVRPVVTQGSEENIKITTPIDIELAEAILRRRGRA